MLHVHLVPYPDKSSNHMGVHFFALLVCYLWVSRYTKSPKMTRVVHCFSKKLLSKYTTCLGWTVALVLFTSPKENHNQVSLKLTEECMSDDPVENYGVLGGWQCLSGIAPELYE